MKKQMATLVGAALLVAVLAGVIYRGYDLFVAREPSADGQAGEGAAGLPRQTKVVIPADPDVVAIERSMEERDQIAQAVIDGRLTLVKAAAQFRAINTSRPPHYQVRLDLLPGQSDEERVCRQVIRYVESKLADRPDASAILARLESELRAHLAAEETIRGPILPAQAPKRTAE